MNFNILFFSTLFYFFFIPNQAYAYIDPGIFTFLWQALIVLFITVWVFFKDMIFQITTFFKNIQKKLFNKKQNLMSNFSI